MEVTKIGTQIELVYTTQFVTFTPDQFNKALKDKNYLEVRGTIPDSRGQPTPIQTFSKGDFIVYLAPGDPPPLVFRLINTLNIEPKLKEINEMLINLNIYNDVIALARFACQTRVKGKKKPLDSLTSLVNKTFVSKICKTMDNDMKVSGIKFDTTFPMRNEGGCSVDIEPLITNSEKEYFVAIGYSERDMSKFNRFISQFGDQVIQEMIEEV
ncbi:MAG: hypothetical protein ABSC91_08590 [Candidatus Bathyarchaeia archaeon]